MKDFLRKKLVDLGIYYIYLDRKFYKLGHNKAQLDFYVKLVGRDSLVFDIGANKGQRSRIFADLGANVVCFEPQPNCLKHLKSRFQRNGKVSIEPIGLAAQSGKSEMYLSNLDTISTLSNKHRDEFGKKVFKESKWEETITININTLDWAIEKYGVPDFIKIDVEGFEFEVLKGLSHPVKAISFEFTPMREVFDTTVNCINYLTSLNPNYRFNFSLGEDLVFELEEHISGEDLLKMDAFVKAKNFGDVYAFLVK